MAIAQEYSTIRTRPRQGEKRGRHTKGQAAKRTACNARPGFLDHSFVPIIGQRLAGLGSYRQIAREFFDSLAHLAALHGIAIPDVAEVDYPLNIAQAFKSARQQLRALCPDLDLMILKDNERKCCVATIKTFDTGTWLYYIPVKPLHLLLRKEKKAQAHLLLSAFSYLYRVGKVPYFTEGYLCDTYDMIHKWYTEDPANFDDEDYLHILEEFKTMEHFGGKLLASIRHPYHVQQFESRVRQFTPLTAGDAELLGICTKLLYLYRQYPDRSVFDNVREGLQCSNGEERIQLDQYVSFFWSGEGDIYQQVIESVNAQFQETGCMEEPQTVQFFDTPQKEERHDLDFEQRLFECIHELNEHLNDL